MRHRIIARDKSFLQFKEESFLGKIFLMSKVRGNDYISAGMIVCTASVKCSSSYSNFVIVKIISVTGSRREEF